MDLIHQLVELIHFARDWTVDWAFTPYGTIALFLIAFAESSFFPIPPDALLIPLAASAPEKALMFAAVCSVGSVLGGMAGYWIGRWGGAPLLRRFFNPEKLLMVQGYYKRYDIWAVGLAGFTPIPYKLFSLSSGAFELDFRRFVLATIVGRSARFFLVGLVVYVFRDQVEMIMDEYFDVALVVFSVMLIGGFWIVNVLGKRAAKSGAEGSIKG